MTTVSAHVHRFHDFAAIAFTGVDGETVYLTAPDALRLVASVRACLPDLKHYAGTHGTGPDVRLAALLVALDGAA